MKKRPRVHLSVRQMEFCEYFVGGMTAREAAKSAGYLDYISNPSQMMKIPAVKQYIEKLRTRAMKKHDITVEKVLTDLQRAMDLAEQERQATGIINASMAQAKIVGLVVDKVERKDVNEMSMEEVQMSLRMALGEQAADTLFKALGVKKDDEPKFEDFPEASGTVQ